MSLRSVAERSEKIISYQATSLSSHLEAIDQVLKTPPPVPVLAPPQDTMKDNQRCKYGFTACVWKLHWSWIMRLSGKL